MSHLPDFSSRQPARAASRAPGESAGLVAALLLLTLAVGAGLKARHELRLAREELDLARRAAGTAAGRDHAPARAAGPVDALRAQARLARAAPPPRVLADLEVLLPPGVRCESIGLSYGPELRLELAVLARSARDYDRFLAALEASPRFADMVPGRENRDGEVRSSLTLRYLTDAGTSPGRPEPRP